MMVALGAIAALAPQIMLGLFVADPTVLSAGDLAMRISLLILPASGITFVLNGALRGAAVGDNRRAPLAFGQLNPTGALAPDKTLTLTRTLTGGALTQTIALYMVLFAFLAALPVIIGFISDVPVASFLPLDAVWLAILVVYIGRAVRVGLVARKATVQADQMAIADKPTNDGKRIAQRQQLPPGNNAVLPRGQRRQRRLHHGADADAGEDHRLSADAVR